MRATVVARQLLSCRYQWRRRTLHRLFSTNPSDDLVQTTIDESTGVATLLMNRPPVNSLSLELCQAISQSIKEIEATKAQGLVLASAVPKILSAGLDLTELYSPDMERLPEFWSSFQQLFLDLYGSRLATVAAIEGHAPAAGCMLALATDYRIMGAGKNDAPITIGLNESQFGIVAPPWLAELMLLTIGHREGEKALALGTLYTPNDALRVGLVDEVVPSPEVMPRALAEAAKWAEIPPMARAGSKSIPRKPLLEKLASTRQNDTDSFVSFVAGQGVQKHLGLYLESLQKKSK